MPIFEMRRGVLLEGFHNGGFVKPKTRGWFLKVVCLIVKWKHPESTVWFETSIAFSAFGFSRALWRKRFMPVVPKAAIDTQIIPDEQIEILRGVQEQGAMLYAYAETRETAGKSVFAAWRQRGKRLTTRDEKRDRRERIAAIIRERKH